MEQQRTELLQAEKRAKEEALIEKKRAEERKRALAARPVAGKIDEWSSFHVAHWIEHDMELPQYADHFQEGGVDGPLLLSLGEEDLSEDLGVEHRLHRKKILRNVGRLRVAKEMYVLYFIYSFYSFFFIFFHFSFFHQSINQSNLTQ